MKTLISSIVLFGTILVGGCLSKPHLERQSFTFAIPPATENSAPNGPGIRVRRVAVTSPFDTRPLTYRTGEFSFERDPYAEFLGAPADILIEPICQYLRNSGGFHEVTDPNSMRTSDLELEINVLQLYGDFRDLTHPAATLRIRFHATRGDASHKVILQKEYSRNIPLRARTAEALVAGWNDALKQITTEAAGDLTAAAK